MRSELLQRRDELQEALRESDQTGGRVCTRSVELTEKLLFVLRLLGKDEVDNALVLQTRLLEHYERCDPMPVLKIAEQLLGLASLHLSRPETASKASALISRALGLADVEEEDEPDAANRVRARAHGISARMHIVLRQEQKAREAHLQSLKLYHGLHKASQYLDTDGDQDSLSNTAALPPATASGEGAVGRLGAGSSAAAGMLGRDKLDSLSWHEFRAHRSALMKL